MPTVLLVDCSLGMAERFPFAIKQGNNMATTMNIEKRSLVAKMIESLMTNINSPTKLETIALVSLVFYLVKYYISFLFI
jgi:hypothetical protein